MWSGRRELYEAAVLGVQLVFDILKLRYKTDLPNTARAHMTEFAINKGNISIAILTEDVDHCIMTRLQMVNPLTGETGLDRVFDETFAARVALQGFLADGAAPRPRRDAGHRHGLSRLKAWRSSALARPTKLGAHSRLGSL